MRLNNNYFSRVFLLVIIIILFVIIKIVVFDKDLSIDTAFSNFVGNYTSGTLTKYMRFITALGDHETIITGYILLILAALFIIKDKAVAVKIPLIGLSALGWMYLLKYSFGRQRPESLLLEASGYSFPSGHSLNSLVFYGLVMYIVNRFTENKYLKYAISVVLIFMIILIGFSRIYLGVHYLTDVIAGFCIGIIWLNLVLYISKFD